MRNGIREWQKAMLIGTQMAVVAHLLTACSPAEMRPHNPATGAGAGLTGQANPPPPVTNRPAPARPLERPPADPPAPVAERPPSHPTGDLSFEEPPPPAPQAPPTVIAVDNTPSTVRIQDGNRLEGCGGAGCDPAPDTPPPPPAPTPTAVDCLPITLQAQQPSGIERLSVLFVVNPNDNEAPGRLKSLGEALHEFTLRMGETMEINFAALVAGASQGSLYSHNGRSIISSSELNSDQMRQAFGSMLDASRQQATARGHSLIESLHGNLASASFQEQLRSTRFVGGNTALLVVFVSPQDDICSGSQCNRVIGETAAALRQLPGSIFTASVSWNEYTPRFTQIISTGGRALSPTYSYFYNRNDMPTSIMADMAQKVRERINRHEVNLYDSIDVPASVIPAGYRVDTASIVVTAGPNESQMQRLRIGTYDEQNQSIPLLTRGHPGDRLIIQLNLIQ